MPRGRSLSRYNVERLRRRRTHKVQRQNLLLRREYEASVADARRYGVWRGTHPVMEFEGRPSLDVWKRLYRNPVQQIEWKKLLIRAGLILLGSSGTIAKSAVEGFENPARNLREALGNAANLIGPESINMYGRPNNDPFANANPDPDEVLFGIVDPLNNPPPLVNNNEQEGGSIRFFKKTRRHRGKKRFHRSRKH